MDTKQIENTRLATMQAQPAAIVPRVDTSGSAMQEFGFGGSVGRYVTSIRTDTAEGKTLAYLVSMGRHPSLEECDKETIDVVNWLVSGIDLLDEHSGEVKRLPLMRIVLADGRIYQTTSETAGRALLALHSQVREAPWEPPARFAMARVKRRRGEGSYFALTYLPPESAAPAQAPVKKK